MNVSRPSDALSRSADYETLAARFRPIFADAVGDSTLNGTEPPFVWQTGNAPVRGSKCIS